MQSLTSRKLVKLRPDQDDERVRRAQLTSLGRREFAEMNRRSDRAAEAILAPLTEPQRERLVTAMAEVHRLLRLAGLRIERVAPARAEARWCVSQYFAELSNRFEAGFDPERSISAEDGELVPPRGAFLVASIDGEVVACGAVKSISPGVGSLKRMWVAGSVRGLGFGRRMLSALESEARKLGLRTVRLETNRTLVEAIRLYQSSGYVEVRPFNTDPYADHWFEKQLH
jgi:GNAT superfamily N-acetyltransferase